MFKRISIVLVSSVFSAQVVAADVSWVASQGKSCATVCSGGTMAPVSSGKYEGQSYYICAGKFASNDIDDRPGFNLVQQWSPKGELCFAAYGNVSKSVSTYDCLCQDALKTAAKPTADKITKPTAQSSEYNLNWGPGPLRVTKDGDVWQASFGVTVMKEGGGDPARLGGGGSQLPYETTTGVIEIVVDDVIKSTVPLDDVGAITETDVEVSAGTHSAYLILKLSGGQVGGVTETATFEAK